MLKFLFVLLTIGPGMQSSFAQQGFAPADPVMVDPKDQKFLNSRKVKKENGELGVDVRNYEYIEPGVVKHNGIMIGVWGNYLRKTDWGWWGIDGNFTFTNSNHYDGGFYEYDTMTDTTTYTPYETDRQTDIITKTNALAYLQVSEVLRFKTGLGYRYLSSSVPEQGFYLRTGAWVYVPIGIEILDNTNSVYKWKYELTYDQIVWGGIKSDLSNVTSFFDDVYMKQTGSGFNANVQLRYRNRYLFTFFYETWTMDVSDVVYAAPDFPFSEPGNKATATGIRFGYDFY